MDSTCLGNEKDAYQNSNGQWKFDNKSWIAVCKCPDCFEIEREVYLNNLQGMPQSAKNFILNI